MSGQPLSKLLPKGIYRRGRDSFLLSADAVDEIDPELTAKAMQVIAIWSTIDTTFFRITASLLTSDLVTVTQMLLSLTGATARAAAMRMAAKIRLADDSTGLDLYDAVRTATKASNEQRNTYAHNVWAWWSLREDAILLIPAELVVSTDVELMQAVREARQWLQDQTGEPPPVFAGNAMYDLEKIMVYRKGDLDRDVRDAREAEKLVRLLESALSMDVEVRDPARSRLLKEPQVQQALQSRIQGQQTGP